MSSTIDLNLDAGESEESLRSGLEEKLYRVVSSVNIACGGHVGDENSMRASVRLAKTYGLAIGAHPSYPDRAGFGRQNISIEPHELRRSLISQVNSLIEICREEKVELRHLKAHGALYNEAATNPILADVLIEVVQTIRQEHEINMALVGLANSLLLTRARSKGLHICGEAFVDRQYEPNGSLRARSLPGALIEDEALAATQALELVAKASLRNIQTLCIHGDTPNALAVATAVRKSLELAKIQIKASSRPGQPS